MEICVICIKEDPTAPVEGTVEGAYVERGAKCSILKFIL
uniref:Uncharacterized protein n=1 Tax=Myoviridae sp. ctLnO19 TaxID=2825085 RepID=A0A8S5P0W8_9CAUD|nr:MAG TPA: hypothetical protein [Myoviridae sp. ctLnO19]